MQIKQRYEGGKSMAIGLSRWPWASCIIILLILLSQGQAFPQVPSLANSKSQEASADHPNIVLIVADDFGYGDLSCYGSTKIITPHVDKLASKGIRFTDAYVASSLCSPSRYSILTGRYSWRTHLRTGVLKPFAPPLIEEGRTTLASMLKRKGYLTACVGKWHLGMNWALKEDAPVDAEEVVFNSWGTESQQYIDFSKPVESGPLQKGFDYFFGIAGSNNMIPFVFIENERILAPPSVTNNFGPKTLRAPDWDLRSLDRKFTRKAVEIIDNHFRRNSADPLFLYFPTSAIHAPCLPTITKGQSRAGMRGDMVMEFDRMVGEVVKALERNGALENTLLIVTSDNGPLPGDPYAQVQNFRNKAFGEEYDYYQPYFAKHRATHPGIGGQRAGWMTYGHDPTAGLLGFKSDAWEGGLRVPFIVHWPQKIHEASVSDQTICTADLLATFAAIIGENLAEDEGEDSYGFLQNLLDKDAPAARESVTLVAGRSGALVVRQGKWKYIEAVNPPDRSSPTAYPPPPNEFPGAAGVDEVQLYNLMDDVHERNNLARTRPEKVGEMKSILEKVKINAKSERK